MRTFLPLLACLSLTSPLMAGTIIKLHPAATPAQSLSLAKTSPNLTLNRNQNLNPAAQPAAAALTSPAGVQQSFPALKAAPAAPVTTGPADMAAYLASLAKLHGKLPNYEVAAPTPVMVQQLPQDDFHLELMSGPNMHRAVNEMYGYGDVTPLFGPKLQSKTVMVTIGTSSTKQRLARVTAYWVGEAGGDVWTDHHESSTGVALHIGHCAVDPKVIPYGSVVQIPGLGQFLAVDTGSAVISRLAALRSANNGAERDALVIDLFFENRRDGENFASHAPSYTTINWWTPAAIAAHGKLKRHFLAQEDGKRLPAQF